MTRDLSRLPPEYVNLPTSNAFAHEVNDAVLVTMTRILGLCWESGYEQTPPFSSEEMAELTGRLRSALYRRLKQLREMGWIRVDQSGRQIIIRQGTSAVQRIGIDLDDFGATDFFSAVGLPVSQISLAWITE